MMGLCAMGSFSDAHETREIPIIAANLQRLILPRQSQIWAVLRKNDTAQRLAYSLAANFLGRMCLSGEVHDLSPAQWKLSVSAMEFYRRVYPIMRTSKNGKRALLVAHTFGKAFPKSVQISLAESGWKIDETWPATHGIAANLKGKSLRLELAGEFRATVISLHRS
jgi:alpha-galactosidase